MNGTANDPVHMKIVGEKMGLGKLAIVTALTLAPLVITMLMANPALRQALEMKAWNAARRYCRSNAKAWAKLESIAATRYDIARL